MAKLTKLKSGSSIGSQKNFVATFNALIDAIQNIEGLGDIQVDKSNFPYISISYTGEGSSSTSSVGGGIPDGYEEEELNVVTDGKIVKRTVLVKTETKADVETWGSVDQYLMLRIGYDGKLHKGRASFKAGA